jgi:YfiH family protein
MIKTHFFGKDCIIERSLNDRSNLELNLKQQNFYYQNLLLLNQIHSNQVIVIDDHNKIYGNQNLPKVDGIVTNISKIVIGIITADCSPILFYDQEQKIIGACHAGWRGAKSGIIQATIQAMTKLGAKNISAKIGPMIQAESYQISQDFYDDFIKQDPANQQFFSYFDIDSKQLTNLDNYQPQDNNYSAKMHFDLCQYVQKILEDCHVKNIENTKIDTYTNQANYFSYRRAQHQGISDCGRNVSVIAMQ